MRDLIVIGGGLVGLATAWRYLAAHPRRDVLVLERADAVCRGQSGRNSGVVHSGLYYAPGSRKARLCRAGGAALEALCREASLPFARRGKLVVAIEEADLPRLAELERRGAANGVATQRLAGDELQRHEPHVRGRAALWVPETAVCDFGAVGEHLAARLADGGGAVRCGAAVRAVDPTPAGARVVLDGEELAARRVVACAGLEADRLARARDLRVVPFRGEYRRLVAPHDACVRGLVYPVPDPALPFLGVHFTRRVDDVVEVGPNAVLAWRRTPDGGAADALATLTWAGTWKLARRYLLRAGGEYLRARSDELYAAAARRMLPALETSWLAPAPSGTRAQVVGRDGALVDDFAFERRGAVLHVLNAPSPAATSALAIADELVAELDAR
ncbi:MAG: L-2-hydroxyglutarate oxidase [Planctomycetes bacterium]|nr:L-2-hydroxyglutarate oxidase [Planctomycetota bacterium]